MTDPPSLLRWFLSNPDTGEIVVGQRPNAPLVVAMVAGGTGLALGPSRGGRLPLAVARLALGVWAGAELVDGDAPWRRVAGLVTLGGLGALGRRHQGPMVAPAGTATS